MILGGGVTRKKGNIVTPELKAFDVSLAESDNLAIDLF